MPVVIRMARAGTKKRPFYHIVAADSRFPRDGRFIERLGFFNPLLPKDNAERLKLDLEKVKAWMKKGAQPTDRIMRFLDAAGVAKREKRNNPEKSVPRKERKARAEQATKDAEAAEAAAKAAKAAKAEEAKAEAARRNSELTGVPPARARWATGLRRADWSAARRSRRDPIVDLHRRPDGRGALRSAGDRRRQARL